MTVGTRHPVIQGFVFWGGHAEIGSVFNLSCDVDRLGYVRIRQTSGRGDTRLLIPWERSNDILHDPCVSNLPGHTLLPFRQSFDVPAEFCELLLGHAPLLLRQRASASVAAVVRVNKR